MQRAALMDDLILIWAATETADWINQGCPIPLWHGGLQTLSSRVVTTRMTASLVAARTVLVFVYEAVRLATGTWFHAFFLEL